MRKGEATRHGILEGAMALATNVGLEGLSIGDLSQKLGMSKSGLFAHFQSKEALQLAVLEHAAERFVESVVKPTLKMPRGERRLVALFRNWLAWFQSDLHDGGCFFAAASFELDDRPGRIRDRLVELQRDWIELIATIAKTGVLQGEFRADLDPEQVAHDIYGVLLVTHHYTRLLRDPRAEERAWTAFEAVLAGLRVRQSLPSA